MGILDSLRPKQEQFLIRSDGGNGDKFIESLGEAFKGKKKTKTGKSLAKRIAFDKLELVYVIDETVFKSVNFYSMQVLGPRFTLVGNKQACDAINKFIKRTNLFIKLEDAVRDQCICGNGFLEKIRNPEGKLVDVQRVDFKKIDYLRKDGLIAEDASGHAKGYRFPVSDFEFSEDTTEFTPNDILHFKLFSMGNDLALGFIEPLYKLVYLKANVRDGFAQTGYRMGHPLYVIKVGDAPTDNYPGHKPTKEIMDKVENEWTNIEAKHRFIMPFYSTVEEFKPTGVEIQVDLLSHCDSRIAAGFGIPLELVIGDGAGNRATLDVSVTRDLDPRVKSIQNRMAEQLETNLFPDILEAVGLKADTPQVLWMGNIPADLNRKAKRMVSYIEAGILTAEEVRDVVLNEERMKIPETELSKRGVETLGVFDRGHLIPEQAMLLLTRIRNSYKNKIIKLTCDNLAGLIAVKSNIERPKIRIKDKISHEDAIVALKAMEESFPSPSITSLTRRIMSKILSG